MHTNRALGSIYLQKFGNLECRALIVTTLLLFNQTQKIEIINELLE